MIRKFSLLDGLREARATLILAWPLVLAQLAQISFFTTDVIMMGWLGPEFLAGGLLATALMHPAVIGGFGVTTAAAPMISQAIGARELRSIRRTVRQGCWAALVVAAIIIPFLYVAGPIFTFLNQPPSATALAAEYLVYAAWSVPGALLLNVLRAFISAKGNTGVVLVIIASAAVLNAGINYVLMFGHFGFPKLELVGAGIATAITNTLMFLAALAYAVWHKNYRRHFILVRFWKPDWPRFFEFFRIGLPIGLTLLSEVGMFGVAVILMGWLGTNEVAGHAVAIQCASVTFMVPLGISQATTIRVGLSQGRRDPAGVAVSGWVSLAMTLVFMGFTCAAFLIVPDRLAHIFLDPGEAENLLPISLAISYLAVAGLFQFVDGAQVSAAAALRGLNDTKIPMVIALIGYWVVGLGTAYLCGFVFGMRGVGIWTGLAAGLAFVAIAMMVRWAVRERLGLVRHAA